MHMQIPKRNALVIPPNSCPIAKRAEDMIIAAIMPVLILSLLNKTPLKNNSSIIGASMTEEITSKMKDIESKGVGVKSNKGSISGYTEP